MTNFRTTKAHWCAGPRSISLACFLMNILLASSIPALADSAKLAGSVEAVVDGETVRFPSLASKIDVDLQGDLARVRVTQTFVNPLEQPVHARYLFPLNKDSAVFALTMTVGNERIRAVIKEKQEATKTFEAAKKAGKAAVLMTQHRPNMFSQRIANLIPGQPIEVVLEYTQTVPKIDAAYELVVPLVVGPRYQPDVDPNSTVFSQALSKLPLANLVAGIDVPETVAGSRVGINVRLQSAVGFSSVSSATHDLRVDEESGSIVNATLADQEVIANRDFVLRYQLGSATQVSAGVLGYANEESGYFSLLIEPPKSWQEEEVLPREMVFLLDCSGSMSGQPMNASKLFMRSALASLRPIDSFRIIRFSDYATEFSREPLPATPENIAAGIRYTNQLHGSGGTIMRSGIQQALQVSQPAGSVRNVVFLTDGYIGNEYEILGLVERNLGAARLFALGVGSGVNRFLLDELARAGRGFARYLDPTAEVVEQAKSLAARLQTPLLTDVFIDWGDVNPADVTPMQIPDLYAGDSVRVQGRYALPGQYRVPVRGRSGGVPVELPIDIALPAVGEGREDKGEAIAYLWARSAIKDAMQQLSVPRELRLAERSDDELKQQVTQLGLKHSLLTRWTAFVAVSEQIYNAAPELTGETAIIDAKVAGVSRTAYPLGSPTAHGGYAAPEPGTWLGVALLLIFLAYAWYRRLVMPARCDSLPIAVTVRRTPRAKPTSDRFA